MSTAYYLPDETARLVQAFVEERPATCQNLALILDKYPPASVPGNSQGKSDWLRGLAPNSRIDTALTRAAYHRWLAMMSALRATQFNAILDWRMVIGLGGGTVLETDLTLHHLYGIPFIPGSALKGLTRAYVTGEVEGYKSKQIEDDNEEIQGIFGSQEQAGTVIFFDALPSQGEVSFVLDIMNPHYPDYYSKPTELPTNDQNPIPVTFLTVTNTTFTFALAPRNPHNSDHKVHVEKATKWLQEAIVKYGVGGKTSAGYGYFQVVDDKDAEQPDRPTEKTSQAKPAERIRPNLPTFREGQEIPGLVVVVSTDELRHRAPAGGVSAFLRYREFSTKDAFVAISAEFSEAQAWRVGDTRTCIFIREEQHGDYVVWLCKPRPKKDKKK